MAKYLGIDYGMKRCGLAITDSLGMIASAFAGLETAHFDEKIPEILTKEKIDVVVFGLPKRLHGEENEVAAAIRKKKEWLQQKFPALTIDLYDERFTSGMAGKALVEMGASKKDRKEKIHTDIISAVIMLRDYLEWKKHQNI
jgi:putative holliday junction resolvase